MNAEHYYGILHSLFYNLSLFVLDFLKSHPGEERIP